MALAGLFTVRREPGGRPQGANGAGGFLSWPGLQVWAAGQPPPTRDEALSLPGIGRGVEIMQAVIGSLQPVPVRGEWLRERVNETLDVPTVLRDPDPAGLGPSKWTADAVADLMLVGNAVGDMRARQADGSPVSVPLWEPERVGWQRDSVTGLHQYTVAPDSGPAIRLDPSQVWHAAVGGRSGDRFGFGIVQQYAAQLRIMLAVEEQQHVIMRSGQPVGVLTVDADMLPDELRSAKQAFIEGVHGDGIAALVKAKFEPVSWNAADLALVPAREFNLRTAALICGIPGHMLGVPASSRVYSNVESEWRQFVQTTVARYTSALEDAWSRPFPRHTNVRYPLTDLFRPEALTRWQTYQAMAGLGATSVEEIRQAEGMGPLLGTAYPNGYAGRTPQPVGQDEQEERDGVGDA